MTQLTRDANYALHRAAMGKNDRAPIIISAITRVVHLATRHAWLVIPGFLIAAVLAFGYVSRHIAINTDSDKLLSSSLPWRQQENKLDQLFPQRTDRIIAVIDATTPEAADEAAASLAKALSPQSNVIRTVTRPDGGEFFARNGVLFLKVDEVRRDMAQLIKAQPFLGTLAADPTLRGILGRHLAVARGRAPQKNDARGSAAGVHRDRRRAGSRRTRASTRPSPGAGSSRAKLRSRRTFGGSSTSSPSLITARLSPEARRPRRSGPRSRSWG